MKWGLARFAALYRLMAGAKAGRARTASGEEPPGHVPSASPKSKPSGDLGLRREALAERYRRDRSHMTLADLRRATTEILSKGS